MEKRSSISQVLINLSHGINSITDELDGRGQMTDEANITLKCITTRPKKADTTNHLFAKVK